MKNIIRPLAFALVATCAWPAAAQQVTKYPAVSLSGSSSNAASAVASASVNIPTIAYLFGYNGATWDQLQVDGSKFLKVNCAAGCAGGSFNNNADNVATSATNGQSAAFSYVWDGSAWDRLYGDQTNGAWVNVKAAVSLPVTGTFWQATQPVSLSSLPALVAGSAVVGKVGIDQTTPGTTNLVQIGGTLPAFTSTPTFTANAGTNLNTSALALEAGGNLATIAGSITATVAQDNVKQINGVVPLMGNGVTGTGSQRVTIASDNTAFSVNANAGTNLNTSLLALDSSVTSAQITPGTALGALKGNLVQGSVTTASPTYITGQVSPLSLDTGGYLRTIGKTNSAQGSSTSGQSGTLIQGAVTTAAPSYTTAQTSPISLDTSGNVRVNVSAGGVAVGTAGTPASQVISVQGISGGTAVPVTGTFSATATNDLIVVPSANFTRPSNTTAYVVGYLVANSVTAGSVVPMSWTAARVDAGNFYIRRAFMASTGKSVTNASFILHLYTVTPTIANGDGAAWSTTLANLVCDIPITLTDIGTDDAVGWGIPSVGNECNIVSAGGTQLIYGLLSAAAAYPPTSAEVETVNLEIHQN